MRGKYSYRVSAQDLRQAIVEHQQTWDVGVVFRIVPSVTGVVSWYAECVLTAGQGVATGEELMRVRGPLSGRDADLWPGEMLRLMVDTFERLAGDPWSWPPSRRKSLTGE